jgi:hypothetical protein
MASMSRRIVMCETLMAPSVITSTAAAIWR